MKKDYQITQAIKAGDLVLRDQVLENLKPSIANLKSKYQFLNLSEEAIEHIANLAFNEMIEKYPARVTRTLTDYFRTSFNKLMGRYITMELAKDINCSILLDYVNANLEDVKTKQDANWELSKLSGILSMVSFRIESLIYLLENSPLVDRLVGQVLGKPKGSIDAKRLSQAASNKDGILSLCDAYCIVHDIEVTYSYSSSSDENYFNAIDDFQNFMRTLPPGIIRSYQYPELFAEYRSGSREAYVKLVEHNCYLLANVARQFSGRGLYIMDLIDEGYFGLDTAIRNFKPDTGNRFSTYATPWIKQAMGRAIADKSRIVRVPVHKHEEILKFNKAWQDLAQELGEEPRIEDMVAFKNYSYTNALSLYSLRSDASSLNAKVGDDDSDEFGYFIEYDAGKARGEIEELTLIEDVRTLIAACPHITDRYMDILNYRFGLDGQPPLTLEETGALMNLTRERIRQLEAKALGFLRKSVKLQGLEEYMDDPKACLARIKQYKTNPKQKRIFEPPNQVSRTATDRRKLKQTNLLSKYTDSQLGGMNSEEEFDIALAKVCQNPIFKKSLVLRYGPDIKHSDMTHSISRSEWKIFNLAIAELDAELARLRHEEKPEFTSDLELVKELLNSSGAEPGDDNEVILFTPYRSQIKALVRLLPDPVVRIALFMRLGYINNHHFSEAEIASTFALTEVAVHEIISNGLDNLLSISPVAGLNVERIRREMKLTKK